MYGAKLFDGLMHAALDGGFSGEQAMMVVEFEELPIDRRIEFVANMRRVCKATGGNIGQLDLFIWEVLRMQ